MNDDALKKLWQEQKIQSEPLPSDSEQIAQMKQKMKTFDKHIFWRDVREVGVCILILPIFVLFLLHSPTVLAQVGCWIVILSALFIAGRLIHARRRVPAASPTATLRETLRTEIEKVEVQIRLLRSVLWWYVLPIIIGADLFFVGVNRKPVDDAVYLSVTAALSAFLYWINLRAVKTYLLPMKKELEAALDDSRDAQT
jgi:hypothetical protein